MRKWGLTSWLCLLVAATAGAQDPRWIMGKGNSFTRLEERLGGGHRLRAYRIGAPPDRARGRAAIPPGRDAGGDCEPSRAQAGLPAIDSTLMPTAFIRPLMVPPKALRSLLPALGED